MWNNIISGFDEENETVNFGTRAVAECEFAVLETNTLATIQAENKINLASKPAVYAEYSTELGCSLIIDNSVALFNDKCSKILLNLTFDKSIDAACIIENGKFILIGLRNGELHLYHIPSQIKLFTRCFDDLYNSTKTFVGIEHRGEGEALEIFIITSNGKIYRITSLRLQELETACVNEDSTLVKNLEKEIVCCTLFCCNQLVTTACGVEMDGTNLLLLIGKDIRVISDDDTHNIIPLSKDWKLKKIEIVQNKRLCFGLTETGKLLVISLQILIPIFVWDDLQVVDFTILDATVFDAENNLLVITGEESGISNLLLLSWPGFQVKFTLQVQPVSYLVYHQGSSEDIYYVEGFGDDKIDTIRLKAIVECHPEFRLKRILRKGRFKEAEAFARTFNLNIEFVYKSQVQRLMQELQPWNNNLESGKTAFNQFLSLLDKITDEEFVFECCINAIPPDFATTQNLLNYGCSRLSKLLNESNVRQDLLQKMNLLSLRLTTYHHINGSSANIEGWLSFIKADLFGECQKHLKRGEIREFVSIWDRHLYEIKEKLNLNQALMLLEENIPTWVKTEDIILWLCHFAPPMLGLHPDFTTNFLQWTLEKIKTLEVLEREHWPEVGLDLAHSVLNILQAPLAVNDSLTILQENISFFNLRTSVAKLIEIIQLLQDLQTLKTNYGVIISFIDFLQLSDLELINTILERTPVNKIKILMTNFLEKMMFKRRLMPDKVISNFIQELVSSAGNFTLLDEAPWEMSVAELIPCIYETKERLECIIHVLRLAPVPWSGVIMQIAQDALSLTHPLTNDIVECMNNLPQKIIFKKYGLSTLVLKESLVDRTIKFILLQDRESALQDVLTVANSTNYKSSSYQTILKHCIEKGDYVAALEVLASLDSKELSESCKKFCLVTAQQYLKMDNMEKVDKYNEILPLISTKEDWDQFKKCYSLKKNEGLEFSLTDFCFKTDMTKKLNEHTDLVLKDLLQKNVKEEDVITKIPNYVQLLNMSNEEWIASIATKAIQEQFSLAFSLASNIKKLNTLSSDGYFNILSLAVSLLTQYKTGVDAITIEEVVELVYKLITQCIIFCPADNLKEACDIFNLCGILKDTRIFQRKNFGNFYADLTPSNKCFTGLQLHIQKMCKYYLSAKCQIQADPNSSTSAHANGTLDNLLKNDILLNLPLVFSQLKNEQLYLSGISLLTSFYGSICTHNDHFQDENILQIFNENKNIFNENVFQFLRKLTNLRHFDHHLALMVLHCIDRKVVIEKLEEVEKSVACNYQKALSLYCLGLNYCEINNIDVEKEYFKKKYNQCVWAIKSSELGIPNKDIFFENCDYEKHRRLLLNLMKTPAVTLDLLKEYCLTVKFDIQECLELCLEQTLLSWEPTLEFKNNAFGKKEMFVKDSSDSLEKRCDDIIIMMHSENLSLSHEILENLLQEVNCYYYEVINIIMKQMEKFSKVITGEFNKKKLLLNFLSTYTRVSEASMVEQDYWFKRSTQNILPVIAEFRLPFTLLFERENWKIIQPELNLLTYKKWFDVVPLLDLDKDKLCTMAIYCLGSTTRTLKTNNSTIDSTGWCLHLKNASLLAEIRECVGYITNKEMVTASLYYVMHYMPPGADKVAAAEMCYLEGHKWATEEYNDKVKNQLAKVEKKFLSVSTYHILYMNQLGEEKYLQLVLKPLELIYELYHDPSILNRNSGCDIHLPNINKAVDDIGKLNNLNIMNTRFDILNKWLQADNTTMDNSFDDDETRNITLAMINKENQSSVQLETENIIRACYLIESVDLTTAVKHLSVLASGNCSIIVKIRALQCLFSVASKDVIETVTAKNMDKIRELMSTLLIEHEIEKLGLNWLPNESDTAVQSLLKNNSPRAVSKAASICKILGINNPQYWNVILMRMLSYEMIDNLYEILPFLTPHSHLLNQDDFKKAWNTVIIIPLSKVSLPLNEEGRRKVEKSIEMLNKCPILQEMNKTEIMEHCKRLQVEDLLFKLGHL